MSRVPTVQSLEARTLFSVVYEDDVLTVTGTEGNDEITFGRGQIGFGWTLVDNTGVTIKNAANPAGQTLILAPWEFTHLVVRGLGGDDVINYPGNLWQTDVLLDGGAGNDTITASTRLPRVTIVAGEGDDHIRAQRAQVDGGPGDDVEEVIIRVAPGKRPTSRRIPAPGPSRPHTAGCRPAPCP